MKKILWKFAAPVEIIRIILKYEPLYLLFAFPQIIFNSALPILYVYFPKIIIEQLTDGYNYTDIIRTISVYALILLLVNVAVILLKNKSDLHGDIFAKRLKSKIGLISMDLELKDIENPSSRHIIEMAGRAADLTEAMTLVRNIISNIFTVVGLSYIIIQLDWLFILFVAATVIIKVIFVRIQLIHIKKVRELEIENGRFVGYLNNISYFNPGGAKEIRLNSLQGWYMNKVKSYRNDMVNIHYKTYRLSASFNIIMVVILALQSFLILWLLSGRFTDGIISIAEFTMYFAAVAALTASLSSITELMGDYNQQVLNLSDYNTLAELTLRANTAQNSDNPDAFNSESPGKTEFIFRDVCFSYPNTEKQILNNINIKIADKEKLVIVGMNGAGKSTFIKLLCKFYRPTKGTITLNGVNIWDIPNEIYYKIIGAVFQDFANFSFSIKENIILEESSSANAGKLSEIIRSVGLENQIEALPNRYETYLSKHFDSGGIELSGGQIQNIAIARAIYKDSPVLILDEPTASLDAKAESEIYNNFFNLARNKTTVFISHRLAVSTIADKIAVFSDGKIEEYGSHSELINKRGIYAEMYRKQSRAYINKSTIL